MDTPELQELSELIKLNIIDEFQNKHLTKNLIDTIKVVYTLDGFEIRIPAEIYDFKKWFEEGVIVYTNEGSYAQELDSIGSKIQYPYKGGMQTKFIGNHINFVENAINDALVTWSNNNQVNIRVEKKE